MVVFWVEFGSEEEAGLVDLVPTGVSFGGLNNG